MPLWGLNDVASNSCIWAPSQVNQAPTRANANLMYGNTTPNVYFNGVTIGMYAANPAETAVNANNIAEIVITSAGSGYSANASVTFSPAAATQNAVANASSNATGRINAINIANNGVGYSVAPTVTISAPSAISFSGNSTGVVIANSTQKGFILLGSNTALLANGDQVTYGVASGNTGVGGLDNDVVYFVTTANSTAIQLSANLAAFNGGLFINLSSLGTGAQAGHTLQGQTATAVASLGGGRNKGVTAGWNIRTVGTGGRAGRVQYECLVATRQISGDGSDDTKLPDA